MAIVRKSYARSLPPDTARLDVSGACAAEEVVRNSREADQIDGVNDAALVG
jgi:hypothetical protein